MQRPRARILANLETLYREVSARAGVGGDDAARLALTPPAAAASATAAAEPSLLAQVQDLPRLTRLPFGR